MLSFKLHKMRSDKQKTGFTLVELLTVVSVILVLAVLGLPAVRQVLDSFESSVSMRHLISAALANARAIAVREQAYAGIRFQQDLAGNQYMVFIVNDPDIGPWLPGNLGCRAVVGHKPMRLPENVGVMDLRIKREYDENVPVADEIEIEGIDDATSNANIELPEQLTDTTTFSILFSPAAKLVTRQMRVRNRDNANEDNDSSIDDIFNTRNNVEDGIGMFIQDDYPGYGLQRLELSRNNFIIYDKRSLDSVNADSRWTDYLQHLEAIYVSPYTGQIINR